jgi:adenylate kinase family enzyme
MRRVAVVGPSGAGKSTLARELARRLDVRWVEFDAINYLAGWTERPADEMIAIVDARCPADGAWVADGTYSAKGGQLVRARAETVVWLDLPRVTVMLQVTRRTARRALRREVLWNGNRESLRAGAAVVRWAWTQHRLMRERHAAELDPRWVRLTSRRAVAQWLAQLADNPAKWREPSMRGLIRQGRTSRRG